MGNAMRKQSQASLPPMAVASVDRRTSLRSTAVDRAGDVERWLALMNAAIDGSTWRNKHDALATAMGIDKAYLSRLRSGEKPWRIEHVVALPDEIEARFEQLRAEAFGLIVVAPVEGDDAVRHLVSGLCGVLGLNKRKVAS